MLDFVVIGAAQAGLAISYYLNKLEADYLVVDKGPEIGYSWLSRWDSLQLFTPAEFNNLPEMEFPAPAGHYPSKFEVSDYFKTYVKEFDIPIQLNTLITRIEKKEKNFLVIHQEETIETKAVIVATCPFHIPYTPPCTVRVAPEIFQIHSNFYKNTDQLQEGPALVVGAGDSGFQILDEISREGRRTYFSGDTTVKILPQEILGKTLWWWFTYTGFLNISRDTWLGKKIMHSRQPIIGTPVKKILNREQVIPVGHTNDAHQKNILTDKKTLTGVKNIIWATGYRPNFSWIQGLETTADGYPKHKRGVSRMKNMYFIGLPWLHTRGSATLGGIKKDAEYLYRYIRDRNEK